MGTLNTSDYRTAHGQEPDEHCVGRYRYWLTGLNGKTVPLHWSGTIAELRAWAATLSEGIAVQLQP